MSSTRGAGSMAGKGEEALDLAPMGGTTRLVDGIAQRIKEAILDGRLAPGTQLSVPALARSLAVSRSPVREAVLHLVGQGLAVETPRKGVEVATIDHDDLVRIHEIRAFLEAASARYCAMRAPDALGAQLQGILGQQEQMVAQGQAGGYYETNAQLHRLIAQGAENGQLAAMLGQLEGQMTIALQAISTSPAHMREGLGEHARIVAAILARDPDAAETAMRAHICATLARVQAQRGV